MSYDHLADYILRSLNGAKPGAVTPILDLFRLPDGRPDPLRCAELLVNGRARAERLLQDTLRRRGEEDAETLLTTSRGVVTRMLGWQVRLTGAEAVAVLLATAGVEKVFVYAGTSELALCDAVDRVEGTRLINGRGDKESAFMAAGASLQVPNKGAAILHGARGLTNAAGAVADARRNEAGTMFVIGLPSSGSARFLPPHGEPDLLSGMGAFADWSWQAPAVPEGDTERQQAAQRFVAQFRYGLDSIAKAPHRPALFGIPQDVAEQRWIGMDELMATPSAADPAGLLDQPAMEAALQELRAAERPVFLVDDYALRYPGIRQALDRISQAVGGAVLQLRYRRGPMLFERLRRDEVTNFVGWLNQFSPEHMELLDSCDLLVTVEDRNIYERVVGRLPGCRKVAVNTDPEKVLKNEYMSAEDVLIVGDPARVLTKLAERLPPAGGQRPAAWFPEAARTADRVTPEPATTPVDCGRRSVAKALADVLGGWRRPVLVDDSQMFGGLLSEYYDDFPRGLRVFGGHGGFVGGGLAYAIGLAIAHDDVRVMCTLGDQGFTNSFQGLVAAIQQRARVLFVVCNNGESVSLKKQAAASFGASSPERSYLSNVTGFAYHRVTEALGLPSWRVAVPIGGPPHEVAAASSRLWETVAKAATVDGPSMVELVLPADPDVWRGIWITQGFEQAAAVTAG